MTKAKGTNVCRDPPKESQPPQVSARDKVKSVERNTVVGPSHQSTAPTEGLGLLRLTPESPTKSHKPKRVYPPITIASSSRQPSSQYSDQTILPSNHNKKKVPACKYEPCDRTPLLLRGPSQFSRPHTKSTLHTPEDYREIHGPCGTTLGLATDPETDRCQNAFAWGVFYLLLCIFMLVSLCLLFSPTRAPSQNVVAQTETTTSHKTSDDIQRSKNIDWFMVCSWSGFTFLMIFWPTAFFVRQVLCQEPRSRDASEKV